MRSMTIILISTVLTISALYVPQPLLPVLAAQFSVSRETAALLTTIVFIPLSIAPLAYGYLLEAVPAKRILRIAMLLLGLSSLALALVDSYSWMLGWRLFQGLLIPALLTALMTYTSQSAGRGDMQRAMAWYIGATITGGFAGRALSGMIASLFHWRGSFLVLGVSILIAWAWLAQLPETGAMRMQRPRLGLIREILAKPVFRRCYLMIFCFFLVFAAIMNFLPFRLTELTVEADGDGELQTYLAYGKVLSDDWIFQSSLRLKFPFEGASDGEAELAGIVHWVHSPWPRRVFLALEVTTTNPFRSRNGDLEWTALPQVRVGLTRGGHVALMLGVEVPLSDQTWDTRAYVKLLWDFADGGFFKGW